MAANEKITALEEALHTSQAALSKETTRAGLLDRDLRLVTHKHTTYLRHFGSCSEHPDT
jgi:hypothetical protein